VELNIVNEVAALQRLSVGQLPLGSRTIEYTSPDAKVCISGRGAGGFLASAHAFNTYGSSYYQLPFQSAAAVHLVCPALRFLDKGKTSVDLPEEVATAAAEALWQVTRTFYREGQRRRRDAARQERADRQRECRPQGKEMFLTEAVPLVMAEALEHATGGKYRVSRHTLYYSVRPLVQKYTSAELTSSYFEQELLTQYIQEHPEVARWVYSEARGTLYEPHMGREVPLGTREVEQYTFPSWRYDKILFVEKQGLWPVLKDAKLAERFDMAIIAGEGYATEACRMLFQFAHKGKYQLFVIHDADPWGYNIARTLREETRRMPGYEVDVRDIGLMLQMSETSA
jgi:hypothetical protein